MNRHLATVIARLTATFATVFIAFSLLLDPWRDTEADAVTKVLSAFGLHGASQAFGSQVLVVPLQGAPFLAQISPSCSALAAVLAFVSVALFLLRGEVPRRVLATAAACALVFVCNLVRIALSIVVGMYTGSHGLVVFHDWVGTAFGLVYVLGGFTLFLWLLLPSNRRLLKEANRAG